MSVRDSSNHIVVVSAELNHSPLEQLGGMESPLLPELILETGFGIYRHPLWSITLLIVSYLLVFCVGFVGNVLVIYIVLRTPRMKTPTNLYIASLAVADLLIVIICLPSTLISNIYVPWILGWFLCKTVPYVQGVSVCASVYSLVAISVDRFLAIWFPLRSLGNKGLTRCVISGIWIFACVVMLPWALFFNITKTVPGHPEIEFCIEMWPAGWDPNVYFVVGNLLICYLLPLGLVTLCYFFIWLRVWRRYVPSDSESFTSAQLSHMELVHQRSKVSVLKMVLVVVLVFAMSWFPLYTIFTRLKFGGTLSPMEEEVVSLATPIAQWLGSSNSCINPILYGFLNAKFRRVFLSICRRQRQKRRLILSQPPHFKPQVNTHTHTHRPSFANTLV